MNAYAKRYCRIGQILIPILKRRNTEATAWAIPSTVSLSATDCHALLLFENIYSCMIFHTLTVVASVQILLRTSLKTVNCHKIMWDIRVQYWSQNFESNTVSVSVAVQTLVHTSLWFIMVWYHKSPFVDSSYVVQDDCCVDEVDEVDELTTMITTMTRTNWGDAV